MIYVGNNSYVANRGSVIGEDFKTEFYTGKEFVNRVLLES